MSLAEENSSFFTMPRDFPDYIFSLGLTSVSRRSLGIGFVHFQAVPAGASPSPWDSCGVSAVPPITPGGNPWATAGGGRWVP